MEIQCITKDYRQDSTFAFAKITHSTDSRRVTRRGCVGHAGNGVPTMHKFMCPNLECSPATAFSLDELLTVATSSSRSVQFLIKPETCVRSTTFHPYSQSYPDKLWISRGDRLEGCSVTADCRVIPALGLASNSLMLGKLDCRSSNRNQMMIRSIQSSEMSSSVRSHSLFGGEFRRHCLRNLLKCSGLVESQITALG